MMTKQVFLTGATGFIGSSLLQKWLDSTDARLHLLTRGRRQQTTKERILAVLAGLYPPAAIAPMADRIEIVEGDLSLDRLGLKEADSKNLAAKISHIIHCAAAARFDLELEQARNTNVKGTESILALARRCSRLQKLDYIGTAYVAGRRVGLIKEDELDEGQEHHNTYEKSKLEAEKLVRARMPELPITIFRPSIVICDSKTGRVSTHSAFYRLLKMFLQGALKVLPGNPACSLDLVPVDWMADVFYIITAEAASIGKCYHLTAGLDRLTTLEEVRDLASHHFGKEKFAIVPHAEFNAYMARVGDRLSDEERDMMAELNIYLPYLTGRLRFDNSNTMNALKTSDGKPPAVGSYFGTMAEYMIRHTNS